MNPKLSSFLSSPWFKFGGVVVAAFVAGTAAENWFEQFYDRRTLSLREYKTLREQANRVLEMEVKLSDRDYLVMSNGQYLAKLKATNQLEMRQLRDSLQLLQQEKNFLSTNVKKMNDVTTTNLILMRESGDSKLLSLSLSNKITTLQSDLANQSRELTLLRASVDELTKSNLFLMNNPLDRIVYSDLKAIAAKNLLNLRVYWSGDRRDKAIALVNEISPILDYSLKENYGLVYKQIAGTLVRIEKEIKRAELEYTLESGRIKSHVRGLTLEQLKEVNGRQGDVGPKSSAIEIEYQKSRTLLSQLERFKVFWKVVEEHHNRELRTATMRTAYGPRENIKNELYEGLFECLKQTSVEFVKFGPDKVESLLKILGGEKERSDSLILLRNGELQDIRIGQYVSDLFSSESQVLHLGKGQFQMLDRLAEVESASFNSDFIKRNCDLSSYSISIVLLPAGPN